MISAYWWIAPIVGVVGWFVVQHYNDKRETRKEVRAEIRQVTLLVEDVQTKSYFYYSRPESDPAVAAVAQEIRCKLKQIGTRVCAMNRDLPGFSMVSLSVRFRQAVSSRLDDSIRPALQNADPAFEQISSTGAALITALESAFSRRFK